MEKFLYKRVLNPFKASVGSKYKYQVFFVIEIRKLGGNPKYNLSVWGVHGPLASGNCIGSCGQIIDNFIDNKNLVYNKGWNKDLYKKLIQFWKENHLNIVEENSDYYHKLVEIAETFPKFMYHCPWNSVNRGL